MNTIIAYIGYSTDGYVECVTGEQSHLDEIIEPDDLLMESIKERRDAYQNVRVLQYIDCEQNDIRNLALQYKMPTAVSSFYKDGPNALTFRNLEGELSDFMTHMKQTPYFTKEKILRMNLE